MSVQSAVDAPAQPPTSTASDDQIWQGGRSPWPMVGAIVTAVVFVGALVMTGLYMHAYAVNSLYYDQFADVNLVEHLRNGTLSLPLLWAQHNENRIFFPNLITLALAETVHLNIVIEVVISTVFWWAGAATLILTHHRRAPSVNWLWYIPVIAGFGSLLTQSDLLFGFRMSWFLTMFSLSVVLMLLDREEIHRPTTAFAVTAAVIGSFSALQGLLIWPAGLALLLLRRRSRATLVVWIVSACATTALYFFHYDFAQDAVGAGSGPSGPKAMVQFFFTSIGNLFGTGFRTPKSESGYVFAIGVVVFACAVVAIVHGIRHPRGTGPLGVALITFGLLFEASGAIGRTRLGLAAEGRYCIFTLTIWIGSYLALVGPSVHDRIGRGVRWALGSEGTRSTLLSSVPPSRVIKRATAPVVLGCLALLLLLQFDETWHIGITYGQIWKTQRLAGNQVAVNIDDAPSPLISQLLGSYPTAFTKAMVAEAKQQRLSIFATPVAGDDFQKGFVLMVVPTTDSVLHGTEPLDVAVSKPPLRGPVSFVTQPYGAQPRVIGQAQDSAYGWVATWNTLTVPDGHYKLWATARYPKGGTKASPFIWVTVVNANAAASSSHSPSS